MLYYIVRTETIQIKVTPEQKEKIVKFVLLKSEQDNYRYTVSSYLLPLILNVIDNYFINSGSLS